MKKIFAAMITAFLLSAGLVATTSSPAAAVCTYPTTCFSTSAEAEALKAGAKKAKLFVDVDTFGNGRATGVVVFTFLKDNGESVEFTRSYPAPRGEKVKEMSNQARREARLKALRAVRSAIADPQLGERPAVKVLDHIYSFRGLTPGDYTVVVNYQGTDEEYVGSTTSTEITVKGPGRR